MNCRLRRQEKRDNLESQVRNMCVYFALFFDNIHRAIKIQLEIPIFFLNISCGKKQPDNYMAYLNLKNSLRERCEKSNNLFKKIDYIFVFLFFRYAMNCRLRRQENREKLESQVRFFLSSISIHYNTHAIMHMKNLGLNLYSEIFFHISYM